MPGLPLIPARSKQIFRKDLAFARAGERLLEKHPRFIFVQVGIGAGGMPGVFTRPPRGDQVLFDEKKTAPGKARFF